MVGDEGEVPTTSKRPYLIRAMHEWISDNQLTPIIVVDANYPDVSVPPDQVTEGKIILNVSHLATRSLEIGNSFVEFEARFNGIARQLSIPVGAVLGIYARETGQGMIFTDDFPENDDPDDDGPGDDRPKLRVVK